MNKWPKLLITHMDEIGTSYWHIQSEEHLHKLCLDWIDTNVDIGYYSYDTLGEGTFCDYLMKKYDLNKKDANVLERISKNKLILSRIKDHWEYEHKRNELYIQAIKALETDNGAEAFNVLQGYSQLSEDDPKSNDYFELMEYAECE